VRRLPANTRGTQKQRGYALMMMVFFILLLVLAAAAAAPRVLTDGKREKEVEMIWRGHQYVRAIKLYYRKTGKFPTNIEDLTKPKMGSFRFLRQVYKDPMNKVDGSWRLLYVGAAGQIIGSLKPQPTGVQLPAAGGFGQPVSSLNGAAAAPAAGAQATSGALAPGKAADGPASDAGTGSAPAGSDATDTNSAFQPLSSDSTIIGGNIIGVASKVNQPSLKVYEKAKRYRLFEFYWDPSKDTASAIQQGLQPGPGLGQNINGATPGGTSAPAAPTTNPQQSPQNPAPPENQ
jgi:hypothetical protein